MNFLLNPRFIGKKRQQGDETMGKTAQKLGSRPPRQETRASTRPKTVDKWSKRPMRNPSFEGVSAQGEGKMRVRLRLTHPPAAVKSGRVTRVQLRAFERPKDAPLNARECRLREVKVILTPTRTPALLRGYSQSYFFFAFLSRLGVLGVRNFFLGFLAVLAPWRLIFSILR